MIEYCCNKINSGHHSSIDKNLYDQFRGEYDALIERKANKVMRRDNIMSKAYNEKASKFFVEWKSTRQRKNLFHI